MEMPWWWLVCWIVGVRADPLLPIHFAHMTVDPTAEDLDTVDHEHHLEYAYHHPQHQRSETRHLHHLWLVQVGPDFDDATFQRNTGCPTHPRFQGHSFACTAPYDLLRAQSGVSWFGEYKPAYKLSPALGRRVRAGSFAVKVYVRDVSVRTKWAHYFRRHFPTVQVRRSTTETLVVSKGLTKRHTHLSPIQPTPNDGRAPTPEFSEVLRFLTRQKDTLWVEPWIQHTITNKYAVPFVHNATEPPTYPSHQLIAIGDTGLDTSHCFFHSDSEVIPTSTIVLEPGKIPAAVPYNLNHPHVVAYVAFDYRLEGEENIVTDFEDFDMSLINIYEPTRQY